MLPPYCTSPGPFAAVQHCFVLHTTDRTVADSADFTTPLRDATGVWLEGGTSVASCRRLTWYPDTERALQSAGSRRRNWRGFRRRHDSGLLSGAWLLDSG